MLENLRIALRKERKLVLIFLLTILLPALTLSVFGIRAIRNERFRLAKEEENEARRAARLIKSHIQSEIEAVARVLIETAKEPAFLARDLAGIRDLADKRMGSDPHFGQAVLLYKNGAVFFPLFQLPAAVRSGGRPGADEASLAVERRRAEWLEFTANDHLAAAALYRDLSARAKGRDLRAEMLTGQARCLQKAKNFREAAGVYAGIAGEYPASLTASGLPLGLPARLQAAECHRTLGDPRAAARSVLDAHRELLKKPTALSEDQFKTYASLIEESFAALLDGDEGRRIPKEILEEHADLEKLQAVRMEEWAGVGLLQKEAVPELARKLAQGGPYVQEPFRFSRDVEGGGLLLLAALIPEQDGKTVAGVLGARLNSDRLSEEVLGEAVSAAQLDNGAEVVLADLSGHPLSGQRISVPSPPLVTEYFEDNFPPWRIDLFQGPARGLGLLDLRRNFYFWTILTLVVVLAFGALLIARTIAHEMEILKIKSDFVSSVSHEFKTPLTSIRALMERLVESKVRDPGKMDQYFAIIAQDTDKLTRLVNNLLDFSKIEEGKKEYVLADTDLVRIATEQVERIQKEQESKGPDIRLDVNGVIPPVRADGDALARALANLLSNAVKFTPAGKAIRVRLKGGSEHIVLEVEDEGIGIPPDETAKVFEKFFQGKNALARSAHGTGLGLTLVKHIVEAHGGKVLVESRLGRGSKFSMVIPIKD